MFTGFCAGATTFYEAPLVPLREPVLMNNGVSIVIVVKKKFSLLDFLVSNHANLKDLETLYSTKSVSRHQFIRSQKVYKIPHLVFLKGIFAIEFKCVVLYCLCNTQVTNGCNLKLPIEKAFYQAATKLST